MRASDGLLWMGFDGMDAPGVPEELAPGGVILFARNLDADPASGPARCKALVDALHVHLGADRTLAVDQEIQRLEGELAEVRARMKQYLKELSV